MLLLTLSTSAWAMDRGPVQIHEVMPRSGKHLGRPLSDWVELSHQGEEPMDLRGWRLHDRDGEIYRFGDSLPPLPPGAFVVVKFDGQGEAADELDFEAGAVLHSDLGVEDPFQARDQVELRDTSGRLRDFVAFGDRPGSAADEAVEVGLWIRQDFAGATSPAPGAVAMVEAGSAIGLFPDANEGISSGRWSVYRYEETTPGEPNLLAAPVFRSPPLNSKTPETRPAIGWSGSRGASRYQLEIAQDEEFAALLFAGDLDEPVYAPTFDLPAAKLFVRVRSVGDEGNSSAWSRVRSFEVGTEAGGGDGGGAANRTLGVTPVLQHKDNRMLCLGTHEEFGIHRWDSASESDADLVVGDSPGRRGDEHGDALCTRACFSMLASYYGNSLSQDRVSFEEFGDEGLDNDLGHGLGAWPCEAATQSAGIDCLMQWVFNGTNPISALGAPTASQVKTWIDAGRPIVVVEDNGDGSTHTTIIDGYSQDGKYVRRVDPWTETASLQLLEFMSLLEYHVVPASASTRSDEPTLSRDSDGDGIVDFDETERFRTNPRSKDTDLDSVPDKQDIREYLFDNSGHAFPRPPDVDSDHLRKELDADNDDDGYADGCEDADGDGKYEPSSGETWNFDESDVHSDTPEPNDSPSNATRIGAVGSSWISVGDQDFYYFDATSISEAEVTLRFRDLRPSRELKLLVDGYPALQTVPGTLHIQRQVTPGRHVIEVRGLNEETVNCYSWEFALSPLEIPHYFLTLPDPPLFNYVVPHLDQIVRTFPAEAGTSLDYYVLKLDEPNDVDIHLRTSEGASLSLELRDDEGSMIAAMSAGIGADNSAPGGPPGTYASEGYLFVPQQAAGEYVLVVGGGASGTTYTLGAGPSRLLLDISSSPTPGGAALGSSGEAEIVVPVPEEADSATTDLYVHLSSQLPYTGVRGWSLGLALEGAGNLIATSDTPRPDGFTSVHIVDPAQNGGVAGVVMAAVLDFDQLVTLPSSGRELLLGVTVEAPMPPGVDEQQVEIYFLDGLIGPGDPVDNVFTVRNASLQPENLHDARATIRFTRERPRRDLVLEALSLDRQSVLVDESVDLRAEVWNDSDRLVPGASLVFFVDGQAIAEESVENLAPGEKRTVGASWTFRQTGEHTVVAAVDREGNLPDTNRGNNATSAKVEVEFESSPGWRKPDLALAGLQIEPSRADPGDPVLITARLSNYRLYELHGRSDVTLLIDNEPAAVYSVHDIDTGAVDVGLQWTATPGRHAVELRAEHEFSIEEKTFSNNRVYGYVRVSGGNPSPDIEVDATPGELPRFPEPGSMTARVGNLGFENAEFVDYVVTIDGIELERGTLDDLLAGETREIGLNLGRLSAGFHNLVIQIDPVDRLDDDSLQSFWSSEIFVPGLTPIPQGDPSPRRWMPLGPRPILKTTNRDGEDIEEIHVGRMDSIDVSRQDPLHLISGAPTGGIWRSFDRGEHWSPLTDALPSSDFKIARFDPEDDNVIVGVNSEGLYKSRDGGISWNKLVDTNDGRKDYCGIVLRYEDAARPNRLTIYAGTLSGIWRYRVDRDSDTVATTEHLWWRPGMRPDGGESDKPSQIQSLLITHESRPRLVFSVKLMGVIAVDLANLPAVWPDYSTGISAARGSITLANSPAKPDRIFAAVSLVGTDCDSSPNKTRAIRRLYIRDAVDNSWRLLDQISDDARICDDRYTAFDIAVDPTNSDRVFLGGVKFYRMDRDTDGNPVWTMLSRIHDDSKEIMFDPHDPDTMYFTSDGGIYRCDGDGENCEYLNADVSTTQFYDIALAATNPDLIIGGTQDNGTLRYDAPSLTWKMIRGNDGKFCEISARDENVMYSQDQYIDSTRGNQTGGLTGGKYPGQWLRLPTLPSASSTDNKDAQFDLHSSRPTLLIAGNTVLRSLDGGARWTSIGPSGKSVIDRVRIDERSGRYYAARHNGEILVARESAPTVWESVYQRPTGAAVGTLALDPTDSERIYATFDAGSGLRIARFTHSGGWPGTWSSPEDLGRTFPSQRSLAGAFFPVGVRGLVKDPNSETLWVGTDRGIYEGRLFFSNWKWSYDTCGLPRVQVTDLELHPNHEFMVAATYGRGVYKRSLLTSRIDPDIYDVGVRNDFPVNATNLGTVHTKTLGASLSIEDLTFDQLDDRDYFLMTLEDPSARGLTSCYGPGDPEYGDRRAIQGRLEIAATASDNPDPFEIIVYRRDGSLYIPVYSLATRSYLNYSIECPLDIFGRGSVMVSLRSLSGCTGKYALRVFYTHADFRPDSPNLDYDYPNFRPIPEIGLLDGYYPVDPDVINTAFERSKTDFGEQTLVFPWDASGDFRGTLSVLNHGTLGATVSTLDGTDLDSTRATGNGAGAGAGAGSSSLFIPDLESGWYQLRFHDGELGTTFRLDVEPPGVEDGVGPIRRGDANSDGRPDISDAVFILSYLFLGGDVLGCVAAGDTNGDGGVNISDASFLLNFLFLGGTPLPFPHPDCLRSTRLEDERLGCDEPAACGA